MPYLRNLSSIEAFNDKEPWEFTDFERVPQECLTDKAARDAWINNPETDFHVFSHFEGTQANLRLHAESAKHEEANSPFLLKHFASDYDVKTTLEQAQAGVRLMGEAPPAYFEQTLSGNARLHWLFEEPIRFPSRKFAIAVLERIHELIPYDRLPGLDKPALLNPERYYTNGCRWTKLSNHVISAAQIRGFILRVAQKFNWCSAELGKVAVSMGQIADECRKKFPRFTEWPGDFVVGSQGPTFWVDGSASPKSAIVRETGMHTFSAHAPKTFYSWAELVGAKFVEKTEDELMGKAIADIYFDGRTYFLPTPDGRIQDVSKEVLCRKLHILRGLPSRSKTPGEPPLLEKALTHIEEYNRIEGAASCAFYPHGVFEHQGRRILNTHRMEALKPAAEDTVWGPDGKFPWLSEFLDQFFAPHPKEPQLQLDFFRAWCKNFYTSCLHRTPHSGHGMVIAGPVNVGKTLLSRAIIGKLVGGSAEANAYLTGSDTFNSELFDYALWVVDDGSVMTNPNMKRLYTEGVKRTVANREHRVNEKFRKACMVPWQGRIFITCNDDPVSIGNIPNLDGSILEKLIILRAAPRNINFPESAELTAIINKELPFFARWLLNWEPPAHVCQGADPRFGCASYCEDSLARTANFSSAASGFAELLTKWLEDFFQERERDAEVWEGSAMDLRLEMLAIPAYAEILRSYRGDMVPQILLQLHHKKMFKMEVLEDDAGRTFRIHREDRFLKPQAAPVPQTENSKFAK